MTELETLERARMYMQKLANGINPIDGTNIPDEDVVNNLRLSRCFFYVADVLRQVIENGGVAGQKKEKKTPFFLTDKQRSSFSFSSTPISISEVIKRMNALAEDENMKTMSYRTIQDWLLSLGMLEEKLDGNGKTVKRPTKQGEELGIHLESRTGLNGVYFVVVYSLDAQHFILDNLDAIMEFENRRTENQGEPWTAEHDSCLMNLYAKGVPINEIAITLKRNSESIRSRLKKLNLRK